MVGEEILTGGRNTPGVVRRGDVLLRPHKAESETFIPLLRHFESEGIDCTYRYLGTDQDGRDMFTFIPGVVPSQVGYTGRGQLAAFMRIVRTLHDSSSRYLGDSDRVVCHNDLSPCNTVFRGGVPIAVIDWDGAAAGERWEDLARAVWLWANIGGHMRDTEALLGDIRCAMRAYGADRGTASGFSGKLISRMERDLADSDPERWDYLSTVEWVRFSEEWVEDNSGLVDAAAMEGAGHE